MAQFIVLAAGEEFYVETPGGENIPRDLLPSSAVINPMFPDGDGYAPASVIDYRLPSDTQLLRNEVNSVLYSSQSNIAIDELKTLWEMLGDIPTAEDDSIDEQFLHFDTGTPREDVWHWFESMNTGFSVGEMMYAAYPASVDNPFGP